MLGLHAWVEEVEDEYNIWQCFIHSYPGEVATELLILSVCALLLCLWTPFLVITSAPSFHGSSHDLWLMFSFVSPCLLCLYS